MVVVRGEPGVGKTALLDYRVKQVSGCRVGRATGVQSDMEFTAAQVQQLEHDQTQSKPAANPGGSPMSDLLQTVIEAHGGLEHWNQLNSVSARLIQGGALWALKGQAGVPDDVVVTASLHQERVSHRPFGAADRHSSFTPPTSRDRDRRRNRPGGPRPAARAPHRLDRSQRDRVHLESRTGIRIRIR